MKKQTYPIPEGCKAISMEIIDNAIVTTFEPEKVELKYIPKAGDCVKLYAGINIYFCVEDETERYVNSKYMVKGDSVENDRNYDKCGGYIKNSNDRIYTKITPEELQSEFNKLGYEYDFETHEAKKLRLKPKLNDPYYYLDDEGIMIYSEWENDTIDNNRYNLGNCFQTEEAFNKFKDYILKYEAQNN